MGERLDRVLEHARDPEALIAALCDLDDAVADADERAARSARCARDHDGGGGARRRSRRPGR